MSERGSFVTEYIYCSTCFGHVKRMLLDHDKYLCSQVLDSWTGDGDLLPIVSGKIGGSYPGEEIEVMRELLSGLEEKLCHPLRVAVLAEIGAEILTATPISKEL